MGGSMSPGLTQLRLGCTRKCTVYRVRNGIHHDPPIQSSTDGSYFEGGSKRIDIKFKPLKITFLFTVFLPFHEMRFVAT